MAVAAPSTISGSPVDPRTPSADEVIGAIEQRTGALPEIALAYEHDIRTLWITLQPAPKPVFTLGCGESVRKVQQAIPALWPDRKHSPILFLAYRGRGPVYALGGDLDFYLDCVAKNDREALAYYARLAVDIMHANTTSLGWRVITLANVHAKALGGSIDPPRSCNVMIAEASARLGYPEVAFNHFPIAAVPILARRLGVLEAQKILMSGAEYSAQEFCDRGVLDAVAADGGGEAWLRDYASRAFSSHAARLGVFAAFYRHCGGLEAELAQSAERWVEHIMHLTPLDIAKLQRIIQVQDKMLLRLYRHAEAAPVPSLEAK